jgi:hypothetical protein
VGLVAVYVTARCETGKVAYASQVVAIDALRRIRKTRSDRRRRAVSAYRCGFCGEWHLTSKPTRTKEAG